FTEKLADLREDVIARIRFDREKFFDAIHLILCQAETADEIARLVLVSLHQLEAHFLDAGFVELIEDAKDIDRSLLRNACEVEQKIEDRAAREPDLISLHVQRGKRVARAGDDLRI